MLIKHKRIKFKDKLYASSWWNHISY